MFGDELRAVAVPGGAGRCALAGANSIFKIHNSKLPIGLQPAEHASSATNCGPPPPPGCGPLRFHSKPQIQHSKFKIQNSWVPGRAWLYVPVRGAACEGTHKRTQRRTRAAGLRAAKLRPAAVSFETANSTFKIQDSKLIGCRVRLVVYVNSGCSLRRDRTKRTCGTRAAGLRCREAAARQSLRD